MAERAEHCGTPAFTLLTLRRRLGRRQMPGVLVLVDVDAPEVRLEARQVVGTPRRQGRRRRPGQRVFRRRFELQDPGSQHVVPGHPLADAGGDRPEVLAHDDGARPVRFERHHCMELVCSIRHVRTMAGVEALGNPVEALQAHDMIDPQVRSVPDGASHRLDEVAVPVLPHPLGMERGERPVLPTFEEQIRRCPTMHTGHEDMRRPHRVESFRVHTNREIGVERRRGRRHGQLLRRRPLCVEVVAGGGRAPPCRAAGPAASRSARKRAYATSSGCCSAKSQSSSRRDDASPRSDAAIGDRIWRRSRDDVLVIHQGGAVHDGEAPPELVRGQQPSSFVGPGDLGQGQWGRRRSRCRPAGSREGTGSGRPAGRGTPGTAGGHPPWSRRDHRSIAPGLRGRRSSRGPSPGPSALRAAGGTHPSPVSGQGTWGRRSRGPPCPRPTPATPPSPGDSRAECGAPGRARARSDTSPMPHAVPDPPTSP